MGSPVYITPEVLKAGNVDVAVIGATRKYFQRGIKSGDGAGIFSLRSK